MMGCDAGAAEGTLDAGSEPLPTTVQGLPGRAWACQQDRWSVRLEMTVQGWVWWQHWCHSRLGGCEGIASGSNAGQAEWCRWRASGSVHPQHLQVRRNGRDTWTSPPGYHIQPVLLPSTIPGGTCLCWDPHSDPAKAKSFVLRCKGNLGRVSVKQYVV